MQFDLREVPFSTRGSYMAVSRHEAGFRGRNNEAGIFLRTVHGNARNPMVARIQPLLHGKACDYQVKAMPEKVTISLEKGVLTLVYADADTLLIGGQGTGIGVRLDFMPGEMFDFIQPVMSGKEMWYLADCFKNYARYMLFAQSGKVSLDQEWNVSGADYCRFDVEEENGEFTLVIEEVQDSWCRRNRQFDVQQECAGAAERFRQFCDSMPSVPQEYEETREIAAYVNWSSIVRQMGFLKREAMFMSKNWMCNVWSWDHCFNAMALSYHNPKEAWDQFMIMFDQQSVTGRIPDSINDSVIIDNYCKPPIHGWALRKLRKQMELSREQLEEAYEKLGKWTNWWLNYRDQDGDGLCEYTHGNDSGWDNATAFRMLPPVTLPDLAAFLIIQMEVLSEVAEETGRAKDSRMWAQKAADMKSAMEKKLFRDGEPCAIQTVTGEKIENDSLILYLPIILGKRLPENIREYLVSQLKSERFLTAYGLATEDPSSKLYVSDGYWRGPVWAPSTMLIVDGLWECGEEELVKVIARRFCDSVRQSGCAENFDALTGEGLRDRAYTWTASVMLVMAHEYLENPSQCC